MFTIYVFDKSRDGIYHHYQPREFSEACAVARELSRDYPLGTVILTRQGMRPRAFVNGQPITA